MENILTLLNIMIFTHEFLSELEELHSTLHHVVNLNLFLWCSCVFIHPFWFFFHECS
jgi:hypothetical protein